MEEFIQGGVMGVVSLFTGLFVAFACGGIVAFAFGYRDAVAITTVGAGAATYIVGKPLPKVEVRLKTESGEIVTHEDEPGEIQVRGPGVFSAYWQRPEITIESFDNGWFRTGDVAVVESGYYRIMGRMSVDIIKSGGYKLSALEIESTLLDHPCIQECAVMGLPDDTWGEAVTVVVVLKENASLDLSSLREWCKDRMSAYKIPQRLQARFLRRKAFDIPWPHLSRLLIKLDQEVFDGLR
jgi:acyl-CoA synthetase (AMP-forming)/AMP-acid ligase II